MGLREKLRKWYSYETSSSERARISQLEDEVGTLKRLLGGRLSPQPHNRPELQPVSASTPEQKRNPLGWNKNSKAKKPKYEKEPVQISKPILRSSFHRECAKENEFGGSNRDPKMIGSHLMNGLASLTHGINTDQPSADFGVWTAHRPPRTAPSSYITEEMIQNRF